MPAFTTHYLFACEMLPFLQEAAAVPLSAPAVFLGTQGPDVFLFHRLLNPVRSYGSISSRLHRLAPSQLFDAMARAVGQSGNGPVALSYAYGFLFHYALDCTVHPFVYAQQAQLKRKHPLLAGFTLHNRVEFGIDSALLLEKRQDGTPNRFRTHELLTTDEALLDEVSSLLEKVISDVLPDKKVHRAGLLQAWADFRRMENLLRDPSGLVRPLLQCAELLLLPLFFGFFPSSMLRPCRGKRARKKYFNEEHKAWQYPQGTGKKRNENLLELWDEAKQLAQKLVYAFQNACQTGASMREATGERSFLTGEPVQEQGQP